MPNADRIAFIGRQESPVLAYIWTRGDIEDALGESLTNWQWEVLHQRLEKWGADYMSQCFHELVSGVAIPQPEGGADEG